MKSLALALLLSLPVLPACSTGQAESSDEDWRISPADLQPSQEARAFLRSEDGSVWSEDFAQEELSELIDQLYNAGAKSVVFAGIEEIDYVRVSAWLVAELPATDPARSEVFGAYDAWFTEAGHVSETADEGQLYLDLPLD
ncbi:MAG: hypothetical protein AAF682_07880 [Planctomycetota bacterium]